MQRSNCGGGGAKAVHQSVKMHSKSHKDSFAIDMHMMLRKSTPWYNATVAVTTAAATANGKAHKTKKIKKRLLWLMVSVQLVFIGCLWCLQLSGGGGGGRTASLTNDLGVFSKATTAAWTVGRTRNERTKATTVVEAIQRRVNFIFKAPTYSQGRDNRPSPPPQLPSLNVNEFSKDFYLLDSTPSETVNDTGSAEATDEFYSFHLPPEEPIWCFRQGTSLEPVRSSEDDSPTLTRQCHCLSDWHGKDCGQPEVIWRALISAKWPMRFASPAEGKSPHRLIYMIEGFFNSLDLLELQLQAVKEVVDFYFIFRQLGPTSQEVPQGKELKALLFKLKETLPKGNFFVYHAHNKTTEMAYRYFRSQLSVSALSPLDLFVYTQDVDILSPKALKFLKYYATEDLGLLRLRLKYNAYGFYWQHPQQTQLSGLITHFGHLDSPNLGKKDPRELLHLMEYKSVTSAIPPMVTVGDLNHYAGWHCRYCQQPEEIIVELGSGDGRDQAAAKIQFPNATRNHHIDVAYVQKLISTGLFVDGRTSLIKLRHSTDKYYAPPGAEEKSWQFGHLLTNIYESLLYDNFEEADDGVS